MITKIKKHVELHKKEKALRRFLLNYLGKNSLDLTDIYSMNIETKLVSKIKAATIEFKLDV